MEASTKNGPPDNVFVARDPLMPRLIGMAAILKIQKARGLLTRAPETLN
jgi:hypothetical protein